MSKKNGKGKKVKNQRVRLRGDASEEAALRIEELARGLRSGVVQFAAGEVAIDVPAGSELAWEIEARQGRRKSRIEIEIRWRTPESGDDGDDEDDEDEDEDEADTEAEVVAEVEAEAGTDGTAADNPASEPSASDETKPELENPAW